MTDSNTEENLPENPDSKTGLNKLPLAAWILFGILLVFALGAAGGFLGYQSGIDERLSAESTQVSSWVEEQYQMGLQDIEAGRFYNARQRFEAIIHKDPTYPGVVDRLTEVIMVLSATDTPTPSPTSTPTLTLTPTVDLRGAVELFDQAKQYLAEEKWDEALNTLEALRQENIAYRTIDVDGMYYVALRNRGMQNIAQGYLEVGMYDLSLAERFGYLDGQAEGSRTWTRLYLTGASFWEVDWGKASYYFAQVYPYAAVRDRTGLSSKDRYRIATLRYADKLARGGDSCGALKQYEAVMALGLDPEVQPTVDGVRGACTGSQVAEENPPAQDPDPAPTSTPPPPEVNPTVENPSLPVEETPDSPEAEAEEPPAASP